MFLLAENVLAGSSLQRNIQRILEASHIPSGLGSVLDPQKRTTMAPLPDWSLWFGRRPRFH